MNAIGSGVAGISTGMTQLNNSAKSIANLATDETVSLEKETVNQIEAKTQVQASAKVVEAANNALGSIINIEV